MLRMRRRCPRHSKRPAKAHTPRNAGDYASATAALATHSRRAREACHQHALALRDRVKHVNGAVKHLTCGACSAVVSRTAVAPLERVKMEVILNHDHHNSWRRAVSHIWDRGGA